MKLVPKTILPRTPDNSVQRIPRVIYQTFKNNTVSDTLYDNFLSYYDLNPEYRYEFFDDQRMLDYVYNYDCTEFNFKNQDLRRAFDSIAVPAGRADIWRYLIIYKEGGIYVDFDSRCLRPLKYSIDPGDDVVTCRSGWAHNYNDRSKIWLHLFPQWLLMYSPRSAVMKAVIELIVKHVNIRLPVPGSSACDNLLERYTGACVTNYVYRKIFNFKSTDQEERLRPGTYNLQFQGQKIQLHLHKKLEVGEIFNNTIKEKNFPSMPDYIDELKKNDVAHWLNKDKIFTD